MNELLGKLIAQENLQRREARELMNYIIGNDVPDTFKAAFLSALYIKGESPDEISGFAEALRKSAIIGRLPGLTDIVGTGGDGKNTINVSTAASIVASALGIPIAKHGNAAVTGKHGSADFMKYLGYDFSRAGNYAEEDVDEKNYVYIYAPIYNPNFAKFSAVRKKLQFRTVFNFLGPLTNPLDPDVLIIGTIDRNLSRIIAGVLLEQKKRGFVITSSDGFDEISPMEKSYIYAVGSKIVESEFEPADILEEKVRFKDIVAEDPQKSFSITIDGLAGRNRKAAEFISLNASPAIVANSLANSLEEGYEIALKCIDDGDALRQVRKITGDGAPAEIRS